jgi:ABC-type transport system involved in cytochrome c biogenesis ATPase subunit
VTSTALVTVLRAAGRAGVAVCLWGDPGIGKSSLIQAAAAADGVPWRPAGGGRVLQARTASIRAVPVRPIIFWIGHRVTDEVTANQNLGATRS